MKVRSNGGASSSWWLRIAAGGILLLGAAAAIACSDDDKKDDAAGSTPAATQAASGEEAAVEATAQKVFASWNGNDLAAFREVVSDAGIVSIFGEDGQTVDEVLPDLQDFFGSDQISNITVTNVKVSGATATADVQFVITGSYDKNRWTLSHSGSSWRVDKEDPLPVDVPAGTTLVHIDATEFAFGVDTSAIDANAAFEFANVGKQHHELGLARIQADTNIDDLLQRAAADPEGAPPEGAEFIAGTSADPGDTTNVVFAQPLEPGRYIMVCFVPDETEGENGTPHALKGMYKEFTIK